MTVTRASMLACIVVSIVGVLGWMSGDRLWAASCPQHQRVTDKVGEADSQTEALPVPPSQQNDQAESHAKGWGMGVATVAVLAAAILAGLRIRHRYYSGDGSSHAAQLSLPYPMHNPIPVTQVG